MNDILKPLSFTQVEGLGGFESIKPKAGMQYGLVCLLLAGELTDGWTSTGYKLGLYPLSDTLVYREVLGIAPSFAKDPPEEGFDDFVEITVSQMKKLHVMNPQVDIAIEAIISELNTLIVCWMYRIMGIATVNRKWLDRKAMLKPERILIDSPICSFRYFTPEENLKQYDL